MLSIGTDIVENKRIKNSINDVFLNKILTKKELSVYNSKIGNKKIEYLCGRFAAKEAIIKCLSGYENVNMLDIEILNNKNGKPIVNIKNYDILLSISHEKEYTVAFSLLQK